MTALLIVIYIAFVSLGFPDSLFGVTWHVVHVEFGLPESFGSVYSSKEVLCYTFLTPDTIYILSSEIVISTLR